MSCCNKNIEIKQGTTFSLSVDFTGTGFSLDNVEKIEFMFKRQRNKDADCIKTNVWKSDGTGECTRIENTNTILVPFTETDTYLFNEGQVFYMDTKIYMTGSAQNPPTNIVEIMMSDTLFDGEMPTPPSILPLNATSNGTYTAPEGSGFSPVTVDVDMSFDDLNDRPKYNGVEMTSNTDIPEITESTVSAWGFTKNTGTYVKPSNGIPETDLSAEVQAKLNSGGGTSDFNNLNNRPKYNGTEITSNTDIPEVPTQLAQLSGDSTHRVVTDSEKSSWNAKSDFSGDYEDLTNKPTIPSAVTESTVAEWGFTKNTGTYVKPSDGIPSSDLSSAVQTSLGKADTAVQPSDISDMATETWVEAKGYITEEDIPAIPTKTSDLTNDSGFITASGVPKEIFEVTYGTTTFAEITNALSNGLFPVCVYNDKVYTYVGLSNGYHCLSCVLTTTVYRIYVKSSWGSTQMSVYQKPSDGIPYGDLSNGVQEALLPTVTAGDNGKFLRVSNGAWAVVAVPSPIGEEY